MTNSIKETLENSQKLSRELKLQTLPQFAPLQVKPSANAKGGEAIPLIKTAIEFLKAPQFKGLSYREKEQFLLNKGLNWTQIELAFKVVGNSALENNKKFNIDEFLKSQLTQLPNLPPRIEQSQLSQITKQPPKNFSIWKFVAKWYTTLKPYAIISLATYLLITYTILPLLKHYKIRRDRILERQEKYKKLFNLCQSQVNSIHYKASEIEEQKTRESVRAKESDLQDLILLREEGTPKLIKKIKDYKNWLELEKGKYTNDYYNKDYWSYSKVPGANVKSELRSFRGFVLNSKNF